jgi:uncharacterized protein YbjT (DUF2867 family)
MTRRTRNALIAGASGLVGSFCLQRLLGDGRYDSIHSLVRRPSGIAHPRLVEHVVNFDSLEKEPTLPAVDDVYCCLGTTIAKAGSRDAFEKVDHDYVLSLGRITRDAGAQRFLLVSALGADPVSGVFYNRVKGATELDIQQLDFPALHIFRPSLLTGPRKEFRLGERLAIPVTALLRPLMRGGLARYRAVHADHVAACMIEAAFVDMAGVDIHYPSETGKGSGPSALDPL